MKRKSEGFILVCVSVCVLGFGAHVVFAQQSESVLYVPLIGISSVPRPLALPDGPGKVTYDYAVKNFLSEVSLSDVNVTDDKCSPVKFVEGDDNRNSKLEYAETWRYSCTATIYETTQSIATAIGTANGLPAAHKAYATVVVGSGATPPLVNIINITKVAHPLTLPSEGGAITFTYRVNNPGVVPLANVTVSDDKCREMSSKLGDTNGNSLLDITEVWTYTCTTHLKETTTNTVSVAATANGLKAVGYATLTVTVANPGGDPVPGFQAQEVPSLPETGAHPAVKSTVWAILAGILAALMFFLILIRKNKLEKLKQDIKNP